MRMALFLKMGSQKFLWTWPDTRGSSSATGPVQYAPCQFGGLVRCADTRMGLAKGTLVLNTTLTGRTFALHAPCCKIFGLDVGMNMGKDWRYSSRRRRVGARRSSRVKCWPHCSTALRAAGRSPQGHGPVVGDTIAGTQFRISLRSFGLNAQHAAPIPEHLSAV